MPAASVYSWVIMPLESHEKVVLKTVEVQVIKKRKKGGKKENVKQLFLQADLYLQKTKLKIKMSKHDGFHKDKEQIPNISFKGGHLNAPSGI